MGWSEKIDCRANGESFWKRERIPLHLLGIKNVLTNGSQYNRGSTIEYVKNNYDWIQNIPLVGGYGSGPIEKTVDITVARRFKKRGMSWYKSVANPLLRLRLLKLNGEWDAYWQKQRKEFIRYAA